MYELVTLDDQHEFNLALAKALLDDPNVARGSFGWLFMRTVAGATTANQAHIANVKNDLLPDTAGDDMADRWGAITGVPRKGATPARKDNAYRVFGTPGTPVPDASELAHASGLRFQTDGVDVIAVTGYVDVGIVAIDVGSQTRLNAGETLTFTTGIPGLADDGELQLDIDEDGVDQEEIGAYRARILARFSSPPLGGAQTDYVQWALQQTGIAAAFAYPLRQGLNSVDLAALHEGTGDARILLAGEVAALKTQIDTLRPVGVTFRVLTVTTRAVNVEYLYTPDGDATSKPDWDDTIAPTATAWNAATKTLTMSARPGDLVPGMRIAIKPTAGGGTGEEFVVEALSGGNAVILETAPVPAPVNTDTIYAGGPLVQPIRAAIQALFNALGTANPDANRYGSWEGNLRPGAIDRVSRSIDGVLDGTVTDPPAIVQASDPAESGAATVELLKAGRILARAAH